MSQEKLTVHDLLKVLLLLLILLALRKLVHARRNSPLALLSGPPSTGIPWGRLLEVLSSHDTGTLFERWANDYGSVFKVPTWFGSNMVVLCDPTAVTHFHSKDGAKYGRIPYFARSARMRFGPDNLITADLENHRRQRRVLNPAFSVTALRELTSVFYYSVYRVKDQWDAILGLEREAVIDVQQWARKLTLDAIGLAAFGHDFKAVDIAGQQSPVTKLFDAINKMDDPRSSLFLRLLSFQFPQIFLLPTKSAELFKRQGSSFREMASSLLNNAEKKEGDSQSDTIKDRSILGLLLKSQASHARTKLSLEEVVGQSLLLMAGHETTSGSISWGLVELARHLHVQETLREELRQISDGDPTWDQLMSGLPYLDAVACEVLRLYPPGDMVYRMAIEDDLVPLTSPMKTASGQILTAVHIPKGTIVVSPTLYLNCCKSIWGSDAKQFTPERWLKDAPSNSTKVGNKRLYTFSDGPRSCVGRVFAIAELKAALSVLVRNFSFELRDGPGTKIEVLKTALPSRPKVAGEPGCLLPMRVKKIGNDT